MSRVILCPSAGLEFSDLTCNACTCLRYSLYSSLATVLHCTIGELGKSLEIERTHKTPGSFERSSAECCLFKFRENLKYLAAAQWNTHPPDHTQGGVNNAL